MKTCQVCEREFEPIWDWSENEKSYYSEREYDKAVEMHRKGYCTLTCNQIANDAYDRYVTRMPDFDREESGCSCHISPPCSYCVNKSEEE